MPPARDDDELGAGHCPGAGIVEASLGAGAVDDAGGGTGGATNLEDARLVRRLVRRAEVVPTYEGLQGRGGDLWCGGHCLLVSCRNNWGIWEGAYIGQSSDSLCDARSQREYTPVETGVCDRILLSHPRGDYVATDKLEHWFGSILGCRNVQGRGPSMAVGVVAVLARIRSLTSRVVVVVSVRRSGDRHGTWDGIIDVCNRQNHFVSEGTLRGLGE